MNKKKVVKRLVKIYPYVAKEVLIEQADIMEQQRDELYKRLKDKFSGKKNDSNSIENLRDEIVKKYE